MAGSDAHEFVATEELFRRHAEFVARLLLRLGVASDELDDAVQEVFLVVHRNGGYSPGPAKPTTYLANIAVRAASSYRRRRAALRSRLGDDSPEALPGGGSPVEVMEQTESARLLQLALNQLEPDLRSVLVLVELEGESCVGIARGLGIPVGTVYWRLHRARQKFGAVVRALEEEPPLPERASKIEGCRP